MVSKYKYIKYKMSRNIYDIHLAYTLSLNGTRPCLNFMDVIKGEIPKLYFTGYNLVQFAYQQSENENVFVRLQSIMLFIEVRTWLCANKLSLNINKSKYMLFYKRILKFRPTIDLLINNQPIDRVLEFKFLGFLIDEHLTWSKHTAYISNKMAKNVGMLFKLRKTLNTNTLRNLYFALIHSYLNNGITVWGSAAKIIWRRFLNCKKEL